MDQAYSGEGIEIFVKGAPPPRKITPQIISLQTQVILETRDPIPTPTTPKKVVRVPDKQQEGETYTSVTGSP